MPPQPLFCFPIILYIPGVSHGYTSDSETFRGRTTCGYTSEGGVDLGEIIVVIVILPICDFTSRVGWVLSLSASP